MKTTCQILFASTALLFAAVSHETQAGPLDTWHIRTPVTTEDLSGVAYGNGRFVAVGGGGVIITSPDGVAWTPATSGTTFSLDDVVFGNGIFVVLVSGSPKTMLTSPDGLTWTPRSANTGGGYLKATFDGQRFFVIEGKGSFRTSTNGIDWTTGSINAGGLDPACVVGHNGQWVVAGYKTGNNNKGMLFSAPDLTTWGARDSQLANNLFGAGYINGQWIVAGQGGVMASSPDGVAWTPRDSKTTGFIWDFAANGQYLVAASQWGRMLYSQNGIDWTKAETGLTWHQKSVAFGNNTFVSVGWDGQVAQSDPVPGTGGGQSVPALTIQHQGASNVVISWPLTATGWTLQRTSNFTTWENEPAAVIDTATAHTVTVACAGAKSFRLQKQN